MPTPVRACAAAALAVLAISSGPPARAQTVLEQAMEYRFQLDFHVPDAALQKMLPQGWEPAIATAGPAKDANLRMIFIDRVDILGPDGRRLGKGAARMVYLAVPVKQSSGGSRGQMIIGGLTDDMADVPGAFGVYLHATTAKMSRAATASNGTLIVDETWQFAAAGGEHMDVHVKYERQPANKGGGEVRFYNPSDPTKYQIFRTEQGIDILRNATTNPPDRVMEFSYGGGGGRFAPLFDGSERVLSWDSFPFYNRTVLRP